MFGPWGTLALELVPRGRYLLFRSPVSGVGVVYLVVANGVKEFDLDLPPDRVTQVTLSLGNLLSRSLAGVQVWFSLGRQKRETESAVSRFYLDLFNRVSREVRGIPHPAGSSRIPPSCRRQKRIQRRFP